MEGEENKSKVAQFYADRSIDSAADRLLLTSFSYDPAQTNHVQSFPVSPDVIKLGVHVGIVIFKVNSNWGGDFTCLYRVSVHLIREARADDLRCVCTETSLRRTEQIWDLSHQMLQDDALYIRCHSCYCTHLGPCSYSTTFGCPSHLSMSISPPSFACASRRGACLGWWLIFTLGLCSGTSMNSSARLDVVHYS